jgi:hypothetical protein
MLDELVNQPHSKSTIQTLVDYVGDDKDRFAGFMQYFLGDNWRITQKCSWALGIIGERHPHLIAPYHPILLAQLKADKHDAVKRNIVRLYQFVEIPEVIAGDLFETAMDFLLNPKIAIAIRVFSMTICERIATNYPELIPEVRIAIKSTLEGASTGHRNRAHKILKRLDKRI